MGKRGKSKREKVKEKVVEHEIICNVAELSTE